MQLIDNCTDQNYRAPSEIHAESVARLSNIFKPFIESAIKDHFKINSHVIADDIRFKKKAQRTSIYRALHIKSDLLKKLQLHSIALGLVTSRNQLIDSMKKSIKDTGLNMPHWEKAIRILSLMNLNIKNIENKIQHSYTNNQIGYHSYKSS